MKLDGRPEWIVVTTSGNSSIWAVVLEDGYVQAFNITRNKSYPHPIDPDRVPAGMPPLLIGGDGFLSILTPPVSTANQISNPIILKSSGTIVFTEKSGDIVFWKKNETSRIEVDALPDARLLVDEDERILLLTG